jgi:hypothetical protein
MPNMMATKPESWARARSWLCRLKRQETAQAMQPTSHIHAVRRIGSFRRVNVLREDEYIAGMAKLRVGYFWVLMVMMVGGAVCAAGQAGGGDACARMTAMKLDRATVTSAVVVPEKTAMADAPMGPYRVRVMPAFCRVKVTDRPTADSEIKTEVWLPLAGWNGRLRGIGNGGFAGEIGYEPMGGAVIEGSAVVATDTGHVGGGPGFALGHPEKVKDFGWRAVHDMTVQAKVLVAAFYGKREQKSYFTACSDGGREALMEAQRFPADYDGILAGAPAYNWTGLVAAGAKDMHVMHATAASELPTAKLPAIGAAVRAACDAKDGVADGVLNDPRTCRFDPAVLTCKGAETDACLTGPQVATLEEMYRTKKDAQGKEIFPGYLPGAEDAKGSWDGWVTGPRSAMLFFGTGFFGDFVHEDPQWTLKSFDLDKDYKLATAKDGEALNATDTNLKAFAARGGKLVMYHGCGDGGCCAPVHGARHAALRRWAGGDIVWGGWERIEWRCAA